MAENHHQNDKAGPELLDEFKSGGLHGFLPVYIIPYRQLSSRQELGLSYLSSRQGD